MVEKNLSRDFVSDFIKIYESEPSLWNVKSADYSNKNKKNAAYDKLINKLKEVDENANRESVVRKINNLRSCFRKERKKVLDSRKSGASADDVYHPTLWYYNDLLFLYDQDTPRKSVSNMEDVEVFEESSIEMLDSPGQDSQQSSSTSTAREKKRKVVDDPATQLLNIVKQKLGTKESANDIFGKHVANELDQLPENMQVLAKKYINDILFEAQMGTLNRSTKIVTTVASRTSTSLSQYFADFDEAANE